MKFICKECGEKFICAENLSKHVKYHKINNKEYYDKWLKKENEGKCYECNNETPFLGVQRGYRKYCSKKCSLSGVQKNKKIKFEKNKNKIKESYKFICCECKEKFKTHLKLNKHIIKIHNKKDYYDKWIKKEAEDKCKICGKSTNFTNRLIGKYSGYEICCSSKCREKYKLIKRSKTNLIKYGVENPFQSLKIKEKIKKSCLLKYGVENNMQCEKGKDEFKSSMNKKYGVDWPSQNKECLEKGQKSSRKMKKFKDTNLWYQGSYELDFLNKYYDKFPNIQRGPSIKYIYGGKNKVYHPDFYIPSLNLIIEIKSSWILKRDLEYKEKKKATVSNGFKYLMILDKDYSSFIEDLPSFLLLKTI